MKPNNYENTGAEEYQPDKKYTGNGRTKGRKGRGDSVNSRYSSDPCKHIIQGQKGECGGGTNTHSNSISIYCQGQIKVRVKVNLNLIRVYQIYTDVKYLRWF